MKTGSGMNLAMVNLSLGFSSRLFQVKERVLSGQIVPFVSVNAYSRPYLWNCARQHKAIE